MKFRYCRVCGPTSTERSSWKAPLMGVAVPYELETRIGNMRERFAAGAFRDLAVR